MTWSVFKQFLFVSVVMEDTAWISILDQTYGEIITSK